MKASFELDDQLLREAERAAARSGRSLSELIEEAVRELLIRQKAAAEEKPVNGQETKPFKLPTFKMGGPLPGVNLDSNKELRDYLDENDPESRFKCF